MREIPVSRVVLDYDIYPRNDLVRQNVDQIAEAISVGEEMPPILVDKKTKRCIDGFHRTKATQRVLGDDAKISAIEKSYKSDADMVLDAMRHNAAHGAKLDTHDRTRCIILGERFGLTVDQVAGALHMPSDKLGDLRVTRTAKNGGELTIPLKRTVKHMAGKKLTQRQREANNRLSGMNQSFYANQLIELIESKMLDLSDGKLIAKLRTLHGLLDGVLAVK